MTGEPGDFKWNVLLGAVSLEQAELLSQNAAAELADIVHVRDYVQGCAEPTQKDLDAWTTGAALLTAQVEVRMGHVIMQMRLALQLLEALESGDVDRATAFRTQAAVIESTAASLRHIAAAEDLIALVAERVKAG